MGPKAQIINFMKYKGHQDIKNKFIFTLKGQAHTPLVQKVDFAGLKEKHFLALHLEGRHYS